MLIVKVFCNQKEIDEIRILNVGEVKNGNFCYKIVKPEIKEALIIHKRSKPYFELLRNALNLILRNRKVTDNISLGGKYE